MIVAIILIVVVVLVVGSIVVSGILYVWASNLASDSESTSSLNTFSAEDSSAAISSGSSDTLMKISWNYANQDLNWAFVSIKIEVGDNAFTCEPGEGATCFIEQIGGNDPSLWETTEYLLLKENNADICGSGEQSSCYVNIYVAYSGSIIAGTSEINLS